jgi:hypothetical protein
MWRERFRASVRLLAAVLLLVLLVFGVLESVLPTAPSFVRPIAGVALWIEGETEWSFEAVSDFIVLSFVALFLLVGPLLEGLVHFLMSLVTWGLSGQRKDRPSSRIEPVKPAWFLLLPVTWALSVGLINS